MSVDLSTFTVTRELDVTGLKCPMPLVKARQEIANLAVGDVLKVISTDRGSVKDFQGWAKAAANVELLGQSEDTAGGKTLYIHFVRRVR
jgi:TusA-related sulfurtransferase